MLRFATFGAAGVTVIALLLGKSAAHADSAGISVTPSSISINRGDHDAVDRTGAVGTQGAVSGQVWNDENGDGQIGANEQGLYRRVLFQGTEISPFRLTAP